MIWNSYIQIFSFNILAYCFLWHFFECLLSLTNIQYPYYIALVLYPWTLAALLLIQYIQSSTH